MRVEYIQPLSRAFERMKRELFSPFDLKKWFVIGFTAFLAGFGEFHSSGNLQFPNSSFRRRSKVNLEDVLYFPQRAWEWLGDHPGWAAFIGFALFLGFIIGTILVWLSSRGKFMFLDNVIKGGARVAAPWHEYKKEGNSFFFWNFGLGILLFAIAIVYIGYCIFTLQSIYERTGGGHGLIWPAVLAGAGFLSITLVGGFFFILLRDFIIPIMYRDRISTMDAVQKFSGLFSSEFAHFIGYGIFLLVLSILISIGILLIGCGTCCIGFVILAIPYIGAVALLPISYTFRAFSVEFLEQFGPDYELFPKPVVNPPDPPIPVI